MNYHNMHRFLFLMAAALIVAPVPGRAADFQTVLAGIDRYYESITSLKVPFTQVVEVPALAKERPFQRQPFLLP